MAGFKTSEYKLETDLGKWGMALKKQLLCLIAPKFLKDKVGQETMDYYLKNRKAYKERDTAIWFMGWFFPDETIVERFSNGGISWDKAGKFTKGFLLRG